MKKIIFVILFAMIVSGCTGINTGVATNVATDTAFVMALQTHPEYKPAVIAALTDLKLFLANPVTYDDLIIQINKQFGPKYAYIGIILQGYIEADKPVSTSMITMLDSYKRAVEIKIDRFLLLAGA